MSRAAVFYAINKPCILFSVFFISFARAETSYNLVLLPSEAFLHDQTKYAPAKFYPLGNIHIGLFSTNHSIPSSCNVDRCKRQHITERRQKYQRKLKVKLKE